MGGYAWPKGKLAKQLTFLAVTVVLMGAAGFMARRNLVLGRGDRKGAFRVALVLFVLGIASWVLGAHHVADSNAQMGLLGRGAGLVLLEATLVWLFYLAVEPYARRLRPWTLVSWTRLLGGGISDPVVGRDTLVGLAWAVTLVLLVPFFRLLPAWLGQAGPEPTMGWYDALQGPALLLSSLLEMATGSILFSMGGAAPVRPDAAAAAERPPRDGRDRRVHGGAERSRRPGRALGRGPRVRGLGGVVDRAPAALRAPGRDRRLLRQRGPREPPPHDGPVVVDGRARRSWPSRSWGCSRSRPSAAPWAGRGCAAPSRARRPPGPEGGAPGYSRPRSKTTRPPTIVVRTLTSRIRSGGTAKGSSSRITRSASWPGTSRPFSFSWNSAYAAPAV